MKSLISALYRAEKWNLLNSTIEKFTSLKIIAKMHRLVFKDSLWLNQRIVLFEVCEENIFIPFRIMRSILKSNIVHKNSFYRHQDDSSVTKCSRIMLYWRSIMKKFIWILQKWPENYAENHIIRNRAYFFIKNMIMQLIYKSAWSDLKYFRLNWKQCII